MTVKLARTEKIPRRVGIYRQVAEIKNRDELIGYIKGILSGQPNAPLVSDETVTVERDIANAIMSRRAHYPYSVYLKDYGHIGDTDGPL